MRFLKDVKFELDEKARSVLALRIEDFLRGGGMFTLSEWESMSAAEQELAKEIKRALKLEELLLQRHVSVAATLEDAVALLREAGDEGSAARLLLTDAVNKVQAPQVRA